MKSVIRVNFKIKNGFNKIKSKSGITTTTISNRKENTSSSTSSWRMYSTKTMKMSGITTIPSLQRHLYPDNKPGNKLFEMSSSEAAILDICMKHENKGNRIFFPILIEGKALERTVVDKALERLQRLHPVLRFTVGMHEGRHVFVENEHTVSIPVIERTFSGENLSDDAFLQRLFDTEVRERKFQLNECPHRVWILKSNNNSNEFMVAFDIQHFAFDGASFPSMLNSFFSYCFISLNNEETNDAGNNTKYGNYAQTSDYANMELAEKLGYSVAHWKYVTRPRLLLRGFMDVVKESVQFGITKTLPVSKDNKANGKLKNISLDNNNASFRIVLEKQQLVNLKAAMKRKNGGTITSVVCAAYLQAFGEHFKSNTAKMKINVVVDPKHYTGLSLNQLMYHTSSTFLVGKKPQELLTTSRQFRAKLKQATDEIVPILCGQMIQPYVLKAVPVDFGNVTFGVSSWGARARIHVDYGEWKVKDAFYFHNLEFTNTLIVSVFVLNERLVITGVAPFPRYSKEFLSAITNRVKDILLSIA